MKSFRINIAHRGLAQTIVTRLQSTASASSATSSTLPPVTPEIQIPVKKERGPTDILRALESTISRDPTAPHYKYHDDPYLIPYSQLEKRSYALAQEAGRKAAIWIREKHANLFQHRVADPVIEAFLPKAVYTQKEDVSEEILENAIKEGQKSDAITIYELLEGNLSLEMQQKLLELLCYYNNDEPHTPELLDGKWYARVDQPPTWKNCAVTEKLFASLKSQEPAIAAKAYNTMICGVAKYQMYDRAYNLYEEAEKNNWPIYLETYNYLIAATMSLKTGMKERMDMIIDFFRKIQADGLQPNDGTLTSALQVVAAMATDTASTNLCRDILAEMKAVGVQPSLGSYYYVLRLFYKKSARGAPPTSVLHEIINDLSTRKLKIQHKSDVLFFPYAMEVAANYLQDPILGDRIHRILLQDDNYKFISDGYKENLYYRNYFQLQVKNNSLDEFVKLYYDPIVPHVYTPEPFVISEILLAVEANDPEISRELLPRFWTHIVQFGHLERRDLVEKALNLMVVHCKPPKKSPLHKMFADAAWSVWEFVMHEKSRRIQKINWTGPILGNVAVLCLRADEFDKWTQLISFIYNEQSSIIGALESVQINELLDACILGGYTDSAMDLIQYCSEIGSEDVPSMAVKIHNNLPLLDHQMNRLKSLVSPEVLQITTDTAQ